MDKGGVLGFPPLFWHFVNPLRTCVNLVAVFIKNIMPLSHRQILKGFYLRNREHAFDESTALLEVDNIAFVDFAVGCASDFRESAFDCFMPRKDKFTPAYFENCEMVFHANLPYPVGVSLKGFPLLTTDRKVYAVMV